MTRQILAFAMLTSIGCDQEAEPQPQPIAPPAAPRNAKEIPVEAPYSIISDRDEGPARREVEVNLKKKVTPDALREIALEVKSKEERPHERTAIFYYLPVEFPEIAGEPWASTHFKPTLEVKILGLSTEEEDAMRKIPLDHKGKRIGAGCRIINTRLLI